MAKRIIWDSNSYNKIALLYDIVFSLFLPKKYRIKVAESLIPGNVLDVACGTGALLLHANKKCYGIDLSIGMIYQ